MNSLFVRKLETGAQQVWISCALGRPGVHLRLGGTGVDQHTSRGLARFVQEKGEMNSEIQGTGTLLTELLEAYRGLPRHVQGQVKHLLRESSLQQENYREQNHALVQGGAKYE